MQKLAMQKLRNLRLDSKFEILVISDSGSAEKLGGFAIDSPRHGTIISDSHFLLQGWVLGQDSPAIALQLLADDGRLLKVIPVNQTRADVMQVYGSSIYPNALCGFLDRVSAALVNSTGRLELEAVFQSGSRVKIATLAMREFEPQQISTPTSFSAKPLGQDQLSVRTAISHQYIQGNGIEIGALHSPLPVSGSAQVKYVDRGSVQALRTQYPELNQTTLVEVDIIDNGERLDNVADASQDFVIANHFLEHCQNPILTIRNMLRVLRQDGILYMAVPDKRYTFDVHRPVTNLEHLLWEYHNGTAKSERQHYQEWVKFVDHVQDVVEVEKRVEDLLTRQYSIHFHVWTPEALQLLILALKTELNFMFEVELFLQNAGEMGSMSSSR